jgi:hypothetical protein
MMSDGARRLDDESEIDPEIFPPAAGGLFTKKHIRFLHLLGAGPQGQSDLHDPGERET